MSEVVLHGRASPQHRLKLSKFLIIIKHPAYPDKFDDLLTFFAWDADEGGLHAGTVLLACGLVACNAFNGYLSHDRRGTERAGRHVDQLLHPGTYYFHVPCPSGQSSSYKYPIYPSFSDWVFPHQSMPQGWTSHRYDTAGQMSVSAFAEAESSAISAAVIARDKRCNVSQCHDFAERAHLCPRSEAEWFKRNHMNKYNSQIMLSGDAATDDMANAIVLRSDIHKAFDQGFFLITRKKESWVPHFLRTTYDLGRDYHQVPLDIHPGVRPEFMLVRFAWTIFPYVRSFLEQGVGRLVTVTQVTDAGFEEVQKIIYPGDVAALCSKESSRGRSLSPKKRKPDAETASEEYQLARRQPSPQPPSTSRSPFPTTSSPDLSYGTGFENRLEHPDRADDNDEERLMMLKASARRERRPTKASLICCDYSAAEDANARGILGPSEYGGGHLCMRCLGAEFEEDFE